MATTITLGTTYKDKISGWTGVATARYEYLYGCVRIELSGCDKDGKPTGFVFDEEQIVDVEDAPVAPTSKHGGPRDSAPIAR